MARRRRRTSGGPAARVSPRFPSQQARRASSRIVCLSLCRLVSLVGLLPPTVRDVLLAHPELDSLVEVVMDLGRPPLARFPSGEVGWLGSLDLRGSGIGWGRGA